MGDIPSHKYRGQKAPLLTPDTQQLPPPNFLVIEVNNEEIVGERKRCVRGRGGGGAGNELNSGKLHLQGSPPVYNESV